MQKTPLLLVFTLFLSLLIPSATFAKTDVPSPTPIATPSVNEIADSLKERLKDALGSPVPTASSTSTSPYRAFVGTIKDVIQKTIILDTKDGKRQVTVGEDTTILRSPGNQSIKLDNIRIGDNFIAIGTLKESDVLDGRRLITSSTALTDNAKMAGYGQITAIKGKVLTLTSSDNETTLSVNEQTLFKSKDQTKLTLADFPVNSRVIYTAEKDDDTTVVTVLMLVK